MDIQSVMIVVGVTLVLVIGFNLAIFFSYGRKDSPNEFQMLRNAVRRMKNPWQVEEEALAELSEKVEGLKKKSEENPNLNENSAEGGQDIGR
jgi:hypothetical protein